jgi:hypothetical protein
MENLLLELLRLIRNYKLMTDQFKRNGINDAKIL